MKDLILKTAKRTIDIEMQTIQELHKSINDDFVNAVQSIYETNGRVVVTGIGKSAIIAQKIVATFNSTGTPSLFMHAADAIHGDLGMIGTNDVLLCLSKSGETSEIKVLLPLLRNFGNVLIGMTSNTNSFMAKNVDYVLHTPIKEEADPNNLAPTSSTISQMAMGDALATALLAVRGFSPSDFAQFHPGGALGKHLYLRVHELYVQNEQPKVYASDNIRTIILEMTSKRLGATAVIDKENKLLGIITDGDLRRMLENEKDASHIQAQGIMTKSPKTIQSDALAAKALQVMRQNSITQLIVCDENQKYLGIVHLHDLLKEGLI